MEPPPPYSKTPDAGPDHGVGSSMTGTAAGQPQPHGAPAAGRGQPRQLLADARMPRQHPLAPATVIGPPPPSSPTPPPRQEPAWTGTERRRGRGPSVGARGRRRGSSGSRRPGPGRRGRRTAGCAGARARGPGSRAPTGAAASRRRRGTAPAAREVDHAGAAGEQPRHEVVVLHEPHRGVAAPLSASSRRYIAVGWLPGFLNRIRLAIAPWVAGLVRSRVGRSGSSSNSAWPRRTGRPRSPEGGELGLEPVRNSTSSASILAIQVPVAAARPPPLATPAPSLVTSRTRTTLARAAAYSSSSGSCAAVRARPRPRPPRRPAGSTGQG